MNIEIVNIENEKENYVKNLITQYIQEYDGFIYKVSFNVFHKCPRLELEDIRQQLILSLLVNAKNFDLEKELTKNTYFSYVILTAASTIIKKYWQLKNKINIELVSLDAKIDEATSEDSFNDIVCDGENGYYSPISYYEEREAVKIINETIANFTSLEKKIFNYYMAGYSVDVISKLVKKSRKTIYNVLSSIRETIKNKSL